MFEPLSGSEFAAFRALVHQVTGIHLAPSRSDMLAHRLARRMQALDLAHYRDYYQLLTTGDRQGVEREQFINCLTINKTHFFREQHHFAFLRDQLIPALRARVAAGAPRRLRIWSAACSTGEEPYSIAMVAHRELARDGYAIEIVASDIDTDVLTHAYDGVYAQQRIDEIPAELRAAYFRGKGESWRASEELRSLVEFHRINLMHDRPAFRDRFDAIFLRNVLIYFDRPGQASVCRRLRSHLADAGCLFLGHSESLRGISDDFVLAGPTIYRPQGAPVARSAERPAIVRLATGDVFASCEPVRIDATLGPCVSACVFDPAARIGGMTRFSTADGSRAGGAAARAIEQLVTRVGELGRSPQGLLAKLIGGGSAAPGSRDAGERDVGVAESLLERAAIPIVSKRVGGDARLEVQFFPQSGRLRCRSTRQLRSGR